MALADAADAARVYPSLWPSAEAAKKAFQRAGVRDIPHRRFIYWGMSRTAAEGEIPEGRPWPAAGGGAVRPRGGAGHPRVA